MGEPIKEGEEQPRGEAPSGAGSVNEINPENDPTSARQDANFFRAAVISRLDKLIELAGGENASALIESLDKNTKSNLLLTKELIAQREANEGAPDSVEDKEAAPTEG